MRSFYILSFLICLSVWGACKHDTPAQQEPATASTTEASVPDSLRINPPAMETSSQRPPSQAPANSAPAEKTNGTAQADANMGHDYTFLTFKMFKINNAFVPGKDPKDQPYKDQWVDLLPDGTYKWGKGKDQLYTGNWGYNHDARVLDLIPNDRNQKQTEWNVIFNDDMVVLTGTNAFENVGTQLQLIRIEKVD